MVNQIFPVLIRIKGAISNCYLLLGDRPVLVDAGAPGDLPQILVALKKHGVELKQLALILLTHGHSDQAGCAAELHRRSGALVALHTADAALARSGQNGILAPTSAIGTRTHSTKGHTRCRPDAIALATASADSDPLNESGAMTIFFMARPRWHPPPDASPAAAGR